MKRFYLLVLLTSLLSCQDQPKQKPEFLIGGWERINNNPNTKTYEVWGADFKGIGYTLKGTDTIFKEELSIVEVNDTLIFFVEGVSDNPTPFKFKYQDNNSFICKNPNNEFPKRIKYLWDEETMTATISAEEQSINFVFKKVE